MTSVTEHAKEREHNPEATKAAEKAAAAQKKADEKAAKEKAKAEAESAKPVKDSKNGVTRPSSGVTKLVWETADKLSQELKDAVERAPLVKALEGKVEVGTIHTQYGRWRKYYGLTETKEQRQARLKVIRDRKDAEKATKKAEKAEADAKKAAEKAAKGAAKQQEPQQAAA